MGTRPKDVKEIAAQFASHFDRKPDAVVIAPGRVNLIGEHIDYMGYSVLPCALNQSVKVAIAAEVGKQQEQQQFLTISHVQSDTHPTVKFKTIGDVKVGGEAARWASYVVAAYLGVIEYVVSDNDVQSVGKLIKAKEGVGATVAEKFKTSMSQRTTFPNFILMIDGNIPMAAGVSSSSALVVASAMAIFCALGMSVSPKEVADVCANSERHVGTAGGGMDQASICLSTGGTAQHIHFNPLNAEAVPLPVAARFVVSNTFKEAPKAVHSATHFNRRVFECRMALLLLIKAVVKRKVEADEVPKLTFKKLQEELGKTLNELRGLVDTHIKQIPYTREEIETFASRESLEAVFASPIGGDVWVKNTSFELYRRAIHVLQETQRVEEFVAVCRESEEAVGKATADGGEAVLRRLGNLMNESDRSLVSLYDCSCPELVNMTSLAKQSGAFGSRLTGAGWGGCVVSLVHERDVAKFCDKMQSYYTDEGSTGSSFPTDKSVRVFSVVPGEGARTYLSDTF